ncbi:endothelial cell-specific chemotaxis regulator [Myiozetetes cayanensis]|uniref:endothelial cell-specific chemotaxis regulator n=1 Tax=Myiozetetes cayanensis TaxID=478635 RepID=UPI00215FF7B9|nr:endothelial cell-specific chemotaxis regulator [Myiozetetes cayanensis]
MLLPVLQLLWLFLLLPGSRASTNSSIAAVTGPPQPTTPSPEEKNHTSEPALKPNPSPGPSVTSVGQTAPAKPSTTTTTSTPSTLPASTARDDDSSGNRSTAATSPPPRDQEPTRRERTTTPVTQGVSSSQRGTSEPVTLTLNSSEPTPTDDESPLTVAAFGVISFIVILVVVVIVLVGVVSLRFKCNRSKEEDKQKPGSSMVSESCSADTSQKDNSITLISMKNINMNNSMTYPPSEKVL